MPLASGGPYTSIVSGSNVGISGGAVMRDIVASYLAIAVSIPAGFLSALAWACVNDLAVPSFTPPEFFTPGTKLLTLRCQPYGASPNLAA